MTCVVFNKSLVVNQLVSTNDIESIEAKGGTFIMDAAFDLIARKGGMEVDKRDIGIGVGCKIESRAGEKLLVCLAILKNYETDRSANSHIYFELQEESRKRRDPYDGLGRDKRRDIKHQPLDAERSIGGWSVYAYFVTMVRRECDLRRVRSRRIGEEIQIELGVRSRLDGICQEIQSGVTLRSDLVGLLESHGRAIDRYSCRSHGVDASEGFRHVGIEVVLALWLRRQNFSQMIAFLHMHWPTS